MQERRSEFVCGLELLNLCQDAPAVHWVVDAHGIEVCIAQGHKHRATHCIGDHEGPVFLKLRVDVLEWVGARTKKSQRVRLSWRPASNPPDIPGVESQLKLHKDFSKVNSELESMNQELIDQFQFGNN